NQRRASYDGRPAEKRFRRKMEFAAGAKRAAKAGRDFVIAQIDVRAATGTVRRHARVADLVFAFALETRHHARARFVPDRAEFRKSPRLRCGGGRRLFLDAKLWPGLWRTR